MLEINVKVSDLVDVITQLKDDNVEIVTLNFDEGDDMMPACVSFSCTDADDGAEVGYDTVFAVEL